MNAIDLYSGIGGWTLGMKLSGVCNVASYEWWHEANQTHNFNFNTNHSEIDIRKINPKDLDYNKKIDFVVGSPPCTQFSYANKGGNGDINDGLVDIRKFLEIVQYLQPKYWAMENVPRVAGILENEIKDGGSLSQYAHLVKSIQIVDSADYGVPQNRKRMIAGNFPVELFKAYKKDIEPITLGEVLKTLKKKEIIDPNYGYVIDRKEITELKNEASLTPQEERINRDSKTFHPVYNKMSFPDKLDRPSRTVTATCTRVSRESIIVKATKGFRRLNIRERGVIQGFPITYQFYGKSLNTKFKMIGNAVPPILTYYIFQSMLEVPTNKVKQPRESKYYHHAPKYKSMKSNLGLPKRKFPAKRKFKFAVPNLRYGSGVRFELSNAPKEPDIPWTFKFFHGNSKNIKEIKLNKEINDVLTPVINSTKKNKVFNQSIKEIEKRYKDYKPMKLQELWTSTQLNTDVFDFLDEVGEHVDKILNVADFRKIEPSLLVAIAEDNNKKLIENYKSIVAGMYLLSTLNTKILNR